MCSRINLTILFVVLSCRLSYAIAQFRMVNGVPIEIKESPHTVALFECSEFMCVGSLITLKSVVTAAACVFRKKESDFKVLAGTANKGDLGKGIGQERDVHHIICGERYTMGQTYMNIAVVKLEDHFRETVTVKPVKICDSVLVPGDLMRVNGWGGRIDSDDGVYRHTLHTAPVYIKRKDECQHIFSHYMLSILDTTICASCGGVNVCFGVLGAGAMVGNKLCAVSSGPQIPGQVPSLFTDLNHCKVKEFLQRYVDFNE